MLLCREYKTSGKNLDIIQSCWLCTRHFFPKTNLLDYFVFEIHVCTVRWDQEPMPKTLCFVPMSHATMRPDYIWETVPSVKPGSTQLNDAWAKDRINCKPEYKTRAGGKLTIRPSSGTWKTWSDFVTSQLLDEGTCSGLRTNGKKKTVRWGRLTNGL